MVEINISSSFPHRDTLEKLEEFVAAARQYGFTHFTWNAYAGDQREPSQLTLNAWQER